VVNQAGPKPRRFETAVEPSVEFLSVLAHELRNPIAPLRSATEVLRLICADPLQKHALDIVDRQLTQLTRLVDDLVDVARFRRGLVTLEKQSVDVSAIAEQALETTTPLVDARQQHIEVIFPSEPVFLVCDPVRLIQVLENLLDNAARYTPPGGRIALEIRSAADELVIEVSDTGKGIAAELLPQIFNLFMQEDQPLHRPEGGLGVGLAVVRNLVELHGGTVHAKSEGPGRGSKFVVRLPLVQGAEEDAAKMRPGSASSPRRVLIVEDNVDAAESLAAWLRLRGHTVRTAHDGVAGMNATREFRPDVAVLDIGLPGADGYLVAKQLRQSPETEDILLIAVSGYSSSDVRRRAAEAGFNYYFIKPADPERLAAMIEVTQLAR
jgi:CheY-like chemotaxis protein/two-component sensor histidine kinase